ncbi:MAG TPA: methyltransferase, partial [bacterium]|nr:methyltransferase [bacterium]
MSVKDLQSSDGGVGVETTNGCGLQGPGRPGHPSITDAQIVDMMVAELFNPDFCEKNRRSTSIFLEPYDAIHEPFLHEPYPLNCIGPVARLTAENLEANVNIGRLLVLLGNHTSNATLRALVEEAGRDDVVFEKLRLCANRAMHRIGSLAYAFEWRDNVTFENIDTLLEGLAAYRESNLRIARQMTARLEQLLSQRRCVTVLDLGSGVGGTSSELLNHLATLAQQNRIPANYKSLLHFVLYDISLPQLTVAKTHLQKAYGITDIDCRNGALDAVADVLADVQNTVDVVVSGAAICHVLDKETFFSHLYRIMTPGSVMSFWDPAFGIYQADVIKVCREG